MRVRRGLVVVAVVTTVVALVGCTTTPQVVKQSAISVAVPQPFTSYNPATASGATAVNEEISYATNSGFEYYDNNSRLIADTSFGTVRRVGSSPLAVNYTVNAGVKWSDGVSVGSADMLLAWAANSGALNTPGFDPRAYLAADGSYRKNFPSDVVWFDSSGRGGLQYVTTLPKLGSSGRSMTLAYDEFYVDWQSAFEIGLPAHVVAEKAFGLDSAKQADAALVSAIETNDTAALAKLSRVWNTAFTVSRGRAAKGGVATASFVGDGPYTVTSVGRDGSVSLTANARYRGMRAPRIQDIAVRVLPDSSKQIAALRSGAVDVITPSATAASAKALINLPRITISSGYDAAFEHLDLQFAHSRSGTFDSLAAREAFLKVVPRKKIVDQVAGAFQDEASPRSSFMIFPGAPAYVSAIAQNGSTAYASVDVIGARALLKRAHLTNPTVCILYDPTSAMRVAEFTLIKTSADQAGFRVTDCSSTNWATELGTKGAYDASLFGWKSTSSAVTAPTARLHSGDSSENYNFYASAVTDKLLDTLSHTTDAAGQTQLLTEIDRQLFTDGYGLPLFQLPSLTAFRTTVTGIRRSPFAPGVFWNIWQWRPTG